MTRNAWRVLAADDDPTMGLLMQAALPADEFALTLVHDGAAAVAACRAATFDILLLDVEMPVLDGLQAAREIRAMPGPQLPLILLSGRIDAAFHAQLASLAATHLAKPVHWGRLAAWLHAQLAAGGAAQGLRFPGNSG